MSKFNTTVPKAKTLTENLAGGQAYKQSDELALVSLLLTSFVNDQFYKNAQTTLEDLRKLSEKVKDKEFDIPKDVELKAMKDMQQMGGGRGTFQIRVGG